MSTGHRRQTPYAAPLAAVSTAAAVLAVAFVTLGLARHPQGPTFVLVAAGWASLAALAVLIARALEGDPQ